MSETKSTPVADAAQNTTAPQFSFEEQVMAYSSLYVMALICIVWGTIRSLAFVQSHIERKERIETSITTREAKKFPITASIVLFSLYLIFKTNDAGIGFVLQKVQPFVSPSVYERMEWAQQIVQSKLSAIGVGAAAAVGNATATVTNATTASSTAAVNATLFSGLLQKASDFHPIGAKIVSWMPELNKSNLLHFLLLLLCWEGCVALATILKPLLSFFLSYLPIGDRWPRRNVPWLLVLKRGKREMKEGHLERAPKKDSDYFMLSEWDSHFAIAFLLCSSVGISHLYRRHWVTNNLLGIAFSIFGIENLHLASFKAGAILLSGLFIYDVFWVFATDVMTTVAKGIDAPILLQFPQDLLRNGWFEASKHGMLGLGDIVIPGIFVALLYRFDHYVGTPQAKNAKGAKGRYYCWIVIFAYAFGLLITMGVMHYFKAAQPALLYLVPTCLLIPLMVAGCRGELRALWNYSEEHLVEKSGGGDETKESANNNKKAPAAKQQQQNATAKAEGGTKKENKKSK
uniref:Signal peptide peptidase n=1 Tax=Globodera rostochiensis TaxID=31243 RepID=A0A914GXH5_GLORO